MAAKRTEDDVAILGKTADKDPSPSRSSKSSGIRLQKSLGLPHGVAVVVGVIIGSGIFVSPTGVLKYSGSVGGSLGIWAFCGFISLIGAVCYAELGTTVTKSGSDFAYIHEAFGKVPGFLYLWSALLIIIPVTNAITSLTFAHYLLQPVFPCGPPTFATRCLAACCISFLTAINCINVKWATKVQIVFTITKVLALIVIVIVGIVYLFQGMTQNFANVWEDSKTDPASYAVAFYQGLYSYAGWNYLNFMTEELKNPYRNLPRSIYISVPFIVLIYLMANISYFVIMPKEIMLESKAVAVTFGSMTWMPLGYMMSIFVACSTFGALNASILTSSRLFFVGAREGQLPDALALINITRFTPIPALLFEALLSILHLWTDDVHILITFGTFAEIIFITLSIGALIYMRFAQPHRPRPIKSSLVFPITFLVVCTFLIVMPIIETPKVCLMSLAIMLSGLPVYAIFVAWDDKPDVIHNTLRSFTISVQKLLSAVRQDPQF